MGTCQLLISQSWCWLWPTVLTPLDSWGAQCAPAGFVVQTACLLSDSYFNQHVSHGGFQIAFLFGVKRNLELPVVLFWGIHFRHLRKETEGLGLAGLSIS